MNELWKKGVETESPFSNEFSWMSPVVQDEVQDVLDMRTLLRKIFTAYFCKLYHSEHDPGNQNVGAGLTGNLPTLPNYSTQETCSTSHVIVWEALLEHGNGIKKAWEHWKWTQNWIWLTFGKVDSGGRKLDVHLQVVITFLLAQWNSRGDSEPGGSFFDTLRCVIHSQMYGE